MAKKTIELTEDHIKLLKSIKFESFVFDGDSRNGRIGWGIDQYGPWGGNYPIEDIALVLGHYGEFIPGTEDNVSGKEYPEELQKHFLDLYDDITYNMEYMFDLLIYFTDKGGLTPGKYECNPRLREWKKVE